MQIEIYLQLMASLALLWIARRTWCKCIYRPDFWPPKSLRERFSQAAKMIVFYIKINYLRFVILSTSSLGIYLFVDSVKLIWVMS